MNETIVQLARELEILAHSIRRREEEIRQLFAIVDDVEQNLFLTDVLEHIYSGFKPLLPFERLGCALISDDGKYVTAIWAHSELGPVQIPSGYTRELSGSSLSSLNDPAQPRILNDLEGYLATHPESHSTRLIVAEGGRSSLTCPLVAAGKRLGFLFFTSAKKDTYQSVHQETFKRLAAQVAAVFQRSQIFQKLFEENLELSRRQKSLEIAVATDPLTNVANRNGLNSWLNIALHDDREGFGLLMADIDHFKRVNDTYGHAAGDDVLREFAARLKAGVRGRDVLGRFGGEEFLIILRETDAKTMRVIAERLRQNIARAPFQVNGERLPITASFGAAYFTPGGHKDIGIEDAIVQVDKLLYRAKNEGRNRVVSSANGTENSGSDPK